MPHPGRTASDGCHYCRTTDDNKALERVADALATECARYSTLLVTDHEPLLQRAAEMGGDVHVVNWPDATQSPANDDWLMLPLAAAGDTWARWMVEIADEMIADVIRSGLSGKALTAAIAHVHRLKRPGMVDQVRPMLRAMLRYLRDRGERCAAVTECKADEIDADTRYIGARNGVVDLHAGQLLPAAKGRRHRVTMQVPVVFDPDARG